MSPVYILFYCYKRFITVLCYGESVSVLKDNSIPFSLILLKILLSANKDIIFITINTTMRINEFYYHYYLLFLFIIEQNTNIIITLHHALCKQYRKRTKQSHKYTKTGMTRKKGIRLLQLLLLLLYTTNI